MTVSTQERTSALSSNVPREPIVVERLVEHFPGLSDELGDRAIYLVRADMNIAGTFKSRGGRNAARYAEGLISTASMGNHARGLMVGAVENGQGVDITVPTNAPPEKSSDLFDLWLNLGGDPADFELEQIGTTYGEAEQYAVAKSLRTGSTYIHAYDNPHVITGQGGLLLDILDYVPGLTATVSPTGGGGLLAGLQSSNEELDSPVTVFGIEASGSNSLSRTLRSGSITPIFATNPNKRYGGIAVEKVGVNVVKGLWRSLYDHTNLLTASDDGVRELAELYRQCPQPVMLEPTSLVAVEGLRELLRQNRVANDAVVAVIGTGHNEKTDALLAPKVQGTRIMSAHVLR